MPIMLNPLLTDAGFDPAEVRLLRHQDKRATKGRTPYELWRDNRPEFNRYQATQDVENRKKLTARYWASFVGTLDDETMFVGVYSVKYRGLLKHDAPKPHMDGVDKAGTCDWFDLTLEPAMSDLAGRLFIDWGLNFIEPLSKLDKLPQGWVIALRSSGGVYLLTCPKTKEQYVGSATGGDGFWGRWQDYAQTGHGGNVGLKSRDPSDYQVSILEVAGSACSVEDILKETAKMKETKG